MLKILFDGDMIVFQACVKVETEINWGDGLWTLHAEEGEAKAIVDDRIQSLIDKVLKKLKYEGPYEIILCFTDDENFRKVLYPLYKANRIGKRKPVCYKGVKDWAMEAYSSYQRPTLEADDCIGILATAPGVNAVIVSADKDFKSIPGKFFDMNKGELYETSKAEADRWHFYQTLIGDTADNYPGCHGVGPVGAEKILAKSEDPQELWKLIVAQYAKKGLSEADALLQARVAKILQWENFNVKTREVLLWEPPK